MLILYFYQNIYQIIWNDQGQKTFLDAGPKTGKYEEVHIP
jgi:hypothetical protein